MKISLKYTALVIAMAAAIGGAQATALVINSPTTSIDVVASSFGGTLLDSAVTSVSNISYNGTARTAVYDTGTGLDFYYQFTNSETSQNGVERITGYDFSSLGDSVVSIFQTGSSFGVFTLRAHREFKNPSRHHQLHADHPHQCTRLHRGQFRPVEWDW